MTDPASNAPESKTTALFLMIFKCIIYTFNITINVHLYFDTGLLCTAEHKRGADQAVGQQKAGPSWTGSLKLYGA